MLCECDKSERLFDLGEDATEEEKKERNCKLGIDMKRQALWPVF